MSMGERKYSSKQRIYGFAPRPDHRYRRPRDPDPKRMLRIHIARKPIHETIAFDRNDPAGGGFSTRNCANPRSGTGHAWRRYWARRPSAPDSGQTGGTREN